MTVRMIIVIIIIMMITRGAGVRGGSGGPSSSSSPASLVSEVSSLPGVSTSSMSHTFKNQYLLEHQLGCNHHLNHLADDVLPFL